MANLDSKPGKALRFDDFGSGPYTLYGHNLFVKREWDCKTLQTVSDGQAQHLFQRSQSRQNPIKCSGSR